jgi:predicted RND superfamily exporter protein
MVSSMLIAIVTVIGIATTMHWLFSYQKLSRRGLSHLEALRASLRQSLRPIVWACVTDALAFSSLMAAAVEPVRDYGLMMAIASLATLLAIVLIGPGLASLGLSTRDHVEIAALSRSSSRGQPQPIWIEQFLLHALNFFIQHRTYTLSLLAVWILFVILGSSRLTVETDFLRNFREDSSLVQGYSIVEQQMGGAGVWDVLLPAPVPLTHQYLEVVLQLEDELRQLNDGALSKVLSLADADAAARQSRVLAKLPSQARIAGMQAAMPSFFDSLIALPLGEANQTLRIMLRASERLTASEKTQLIKMVEDCCKRTLQTTRWQEQFSAIDPESLEHRPVVTGYYVLLSHLVQSVVADQWTCFAIATFSIFIALCITTRNWKLSLVALVPNTLPALGAIAAFGVFGWKMNLGAAMIAAVSIGLSVDSSLHYLIDYQRGRRSGLTVIEALERSQLNVGMPVLLSTIALVIGFASLTVSDFLPTVVFGALASITMAIGLIGNLWWLPVLIDLAETKPM